MKITGLLLLLVGLSGCGVVDSASADWTCKEMTAGMTATCQRFAGLTPAGRRAEAAESVKQARLLCPCYNHENPESSINSDNATCRLAARAAELSQVTYGLLRDSTGSNAAEICSRVVLAPICSDIEKALSE